MALHPGVAGMLSPIQPYLEDKAISEIMVNRPQEIVIEKQGIMQSIHVPEYNRRTLTVLFQLIANESQQILDQAHPLLSASLYDNSRVQLVLPPVAKFPCLALRRQSVQQWLWQDYADSHYFAETSAESIDSDALSPEDIELVELYNTKQWHEFLAQAVLYKKNIVISGGTSSGKTTLLNALLTNIPLSERLIILEDTREVSVPHENIVQLLCSKGEQGMAKVTMQDLVQCCLRLRPDRIICGEIRGKEILDFISACSTGHEGSMTSIHANSPKIAFMRMVQMYKLNNVPFMTDDAIMRELNEVIDIVVQLVREKGGRHVKSIYFKLA